MPYLNPARKPPTRAPPLGRHQQRSSTPADHPRSGLVPVSSTPPQERKEAWGPSLPRGGFAGGEPFGDAELEPLVLLDLEPLGLDLEQRAAQEMLALQRHGDHLQRLLDGAGR